MEEDYQSIARHYEDCFEKYGDSHLGVDWPNIEDANERYKIMLEIERFAKLQKRTYSLLDFGCGTGHLLEYIIRNKINQFNYSGCDISQKFVEFCNSKFRDVPFTLVDAIKQPDNIGQYDFIVLNGVFTEKRELSFDQMWVFFTNLITVLYDKASIGIAFNVMSKHVQWEREDLFHVSHDLLADFIVKNITRNYVFRNDYGLYEYTTYLYK